MDEKSLSFLLQKVLNFTSGYIRPKLQPPLLNSRERSHLPAGPVEEDFYGSPVSSLEP